MPPVPVEPEGRWLTAVALGGQGRYAAAWCVLAALLSDPAVPPAVAAHAAVTRASHLRQVGGHAAARPYDALGLRLASGASAPPSVRPGVAPVRPDRAEATPAPPDRDGTGLAAARLDALVGLAADAVGLGDPGAADRLLDAVRQPVREHASWRLRVRWGWVRAELALVRGRPGEAVEPASAALAEAAGAGSRRHQLKSRIVLAVVQAAAGGGSAAAAAELTAVERECAECGLLPLCWPAALAAADLLDRNDTPADPARGALVDRTSDATRRRHAAARTLNALYSRTDPIGKGQMGVSSWHPAQSTLMSLLHSE